MKKQTLFIITIIAFALAIGIWRESNQSAPTAEAALSPTPTLSTGIALPIAQRLPRFQLEDVEGASFTQESLKNHWSLVFFGYTSCPDICPTMLSSLHELSQRLHGLPALQFVFVTIDPGVDNKEKLKEYLKHSPFGEKALKGITGDREAILSISKKMGAHIGDTEEANKEHSGALFLINPQGKLTAIFSNGSKPPAIAQDVKEIVHHYSMAG